MKLSQLMPLGGVGYAGGVTPWGLNGGVGIPPAGLPNASGPGAFAAFTGMPGTSIAPQRSGGYSNPGGSFGSPLQNWLVSKQAQTAATNPLAKPGDIGVTVPIPDPGNGNGGGGASAEDIGLLACAALSGWQKAACEFAARAILPGGGGGPGGTTYRPMVNTEPCPPGYHTDAKTGGCVINGPGSYLPGDIGRPDYVWTPQLGRHGAAVTPIQVQASRLACPPGHVLGDDNMCYDRLAKSHRKWNPGTKPMLSGGDVNALQRAHRLQKSIGKINRRFGPKKKASCSCSPGRKKK